MKNSQNILQSLLHYLEESGVQFFRVFKNEMEDKALAKFSLDLKFSPCILCGSFQDRTKEIISIAHEAGHIMIYRKMTRDESLIYLCAIFVAHGIGLGKVSPKGQEAVLLGEAKASYMGFRILHKMGMNNEELGIAKRFLSKWYRTYEELCQEDVMIRVREKIINDKNSTFLLFPLEDDEKQRLM